MQILPTLLSQRKESDEICVIELYVIHLRTGPIYLASCDQDIVYNGQAFISIPIERGTISKTVDKAIDNMSLKIADVDYDKLLYLLNGFDFRGCNVDILQILYPESLSNASIYRWVFSGYIDAPVFENGEFSCNVRGRLPNIECPNRSFQLTCNSEFGDESCGISKGIGSGYTQVGSNSSYISYGGGNMGNWWQDGIITINGESRQIKSSYDWIIVTYPFFQQITAGMPFTIQRGCDKTTVGCNRHNNRRNYSGYLSIPWETTYR